MNFVMLNPSTADASVDDPTIRKCMQYVKDWGFSKLVVTNLFAYRSPCPERLYTHPSPIGPDNNDYLREVAKMSSIVVAAWGNHGLLNGRYAFVKKLLEPKVLRVLHLNTSGQPGHPLYLSSILKPVRWES